MHSCRKNMFCDFNEICRDGEIECGASVPGPCHRNQVNCRVCRTAGDHDHPDLGGSSASTPFHRQSRTNTTCYLYSIEYGIDLIISSFSFHRTRHWFDEIAVSCTRWLNARDKKTQTYKLKKNQTWTRQRHLSHGVHTHTHTHTHTQSHTLANP